MPLSKLQQNFRDKIPSIVGADSKALIMKAFDNAIKELVDSVERELPEVGFFMDNENYREGRDDYCQEVIKILNNYKQ